MIMTSRERRLCKVLRDLPADHKLRYDNEARRALQQALFRSLIADNDEYLRALFMGRIPEDQEQWILRDAQGMVEGIEYTQAAKGKPCGHIFKCGEATYRCKTCTTDDTCVLCSQCFDSSDHTGHMVYIITSPGNSGCCDCGDVEAWKVPMNCAIHTLNPSSAAGKRKESPTLPDELMESIRMTVGRAIDYMCDVISCSPEQLRLVKTEETIRQDERLSHLASRWYEESEDEDPEFALILWNDEKHTVDEVQNQVARACKEALSFGLDKANETNDIGRSVVSYSKDVGKLLKTAKIIENIKITVTIRSSRDTFREQMCGTIIEWLVDIAGCSVGEENQVLRNTICEEMLKLWRTGSGATNATVGRNGLDDHEIDESAEFNQFILSPAARREAQANRHRVAENESDSDMNTNDRDNDDGDDEAESQANDDEMDLDMERVMVDTDRDLEMRTLGDPEDETELSEATYAGYPPPPPPPPPLPVTALSVRIHGHSRTFSDSDCGEPLVSASLKSKANIEVPKTPWHARRVQARPPGYWLEQSAGYASREAVPLHEDLRQRVRLDWMILFDLRLWKKARIDLRGLYISTVVNVPQFKRILGLRFAGLYTVLAQLYLIADREPDHSIINLSLQMLTTPSITEEIVERGNFLTNLMAILYTFLTSRQVGHPWEMSINATLAFDSGSVTNRRMYHFFMDLKFLFGSEYVQEKLRTEERYVLQFLDLIRLPQGICPNVRAMGDHVEYETDAWISASLLTREINKLCRQFADSFRVREGDDGSVLARAIRTVAKTTVVNATGAERVRFDQAEIKAETRFKTLRPFDFDVNEQGYATKYTVVDFVVEKEPISFHHALHYTLSWLIDCGKSMSRDQLRNLLHFTIKDLKEPLPLLPYKLSIPSFDPESYLMALFDSPLRVCAWLAQMKAGMWVRNGLSLRHQMGTYRGVLHRDLAHHRDIFMLQTAMVICDPSRVLASMIDRFGMDEWMRGNYVVGPGYEPNQLLDVAEDFIHLMIVLLSDRTSLQPIEEESSPQSLAIRRDIAHILCFKPLSFSDLCGRVADKVQESEEFQVILEEMTNYRAPEGLSDSGTFELKQEYLADVDPYIAHYSKNQRDEAENAYRTWMSKVTGKPVTEIVLEPRLRPIQSRIFKDLSSFTGTNLFAQIIYYSLMHPLQSQMSLDIPSTRVEAFLQVVLHLVLTAVLEDKNGEVNGESQSFVYFALCKRAHSGSFLPTIFSILIKMLESEDIKGCHPKIYLILRYFQQRRPITYISVLSKMYASQDVPQYLPLDRQGSSTPRTPLAIDLESQQRQAQELQETKKQQALDRQAKVIAQFQKQQQNFLDNRDNMDWGEDDDDDLDSVATGATEEYKKMWKYPTGKCILCQAETNDTRLFGTFALVTSSTILRQTNLDDPDFVDEVLSTPGNLDRSAEAIRPFGVAGQNRKIVRKPAFDGHEILSEHQGLGKGFPSSHVLRGPVSTGCGHIMHYSCFEGYCIATQRRQLHQIARNHPERLNQKEFVCPLCKALGNTFLPIIWRGKEEAYPGVLQVDLPFNDWLHSCVGLAVSRFHKHAIVEDGQLGSSRYQELFVSYISKAVIPPLASRFTQLRHVQFAGPTTSPQQSSRSSMSGLFTTDEFHSMVSPSQPLATESLLMQELVSVYSRLRDTVKANELSSRFYSSYFSSRAPNTPEDLIYTDTLAKALGFSIAATEVAQRGVQSEAGMTLLDKISSLSLTHLRMLSETASSYVAIGGVRNPSMNNVPALEFAETNANQLSQLFAGHPQISTNDPGFWTKQPLPAALSQDSFVFLAECSVCLAPNFNLDIHHVARLCYLLELVKVALSMATLSTPWPVASNTNVNSNAGPKALHACNTFIHGITTFCNSDRQRGTEGFTPDVSQRLYKTMATYALPYLRKVAILLHVRYGVDFPNTGFADIDEPEIDRLTKALRLPSLEELFNSVGDISNNTPSVTQSIVGGWIEHWKRTSEQPMLRNAALHGLRPSHPAIFELIGLPKHYHTLTHEAMRRRCLTTGKELTDPSLCLFCGDIFCSQGVCCHKAGAGGCNQHMEKCGHDVGLFLNIRKCTILYLHNRNGSWSHAPYLDKHGEVDPGLRRNRQLFLNQKRYDALLRNVWLQHGIPTVISRKLEADINNGGWETL